MRKIIDCDDLFFIVVIIMIGIVSVTGIIAGSCNKSADETFTLLNLDSMQRENERRGRWIDSVKKAHMEQDIKNNKPDTNAQP